MPSPITRSIKPQLERCGYRPSLLIPDFPVGDRSVPLAAFAHEPADAATACVALIECDGNPAPAIAQLRELGAPVFFVLQGDRLQCWRQGVDEPRCLATLQRGDIGAYLERHREELAPGAIYRAKTRGRFEHRYQLSFVDAGLMPLVDGELGSRLSTLVEQAVVAVRHRLGRRPLTPQLGQWLFRSVFWLLVAKILHDKRVPGFELLDLKRLDDVFNRVAGHYGAKTREFSLTAKKRRRALELAAETLARFPSLAHVTTEALAAVYENTLVSKETRTAFGTHSTPAFLAHYVVWRLAPWIEEMAPDERRVLEPMCGQGVFLVAALRLLRSLLPDRFEPAERRACLRRSLHGLDVDPFAIELARLSLTLADVPNPDGWDLECRDVFADDQLSNRTAESRILLANPPFEAFTVEERQRLARQGFEVRAGSKAAELLRRTLPHMVAGSIFGVVVPQGFLHSSSAGDVRSHLVERFELLEIVQLPDKIFTYSDAECALLLGRRGRRRPQVPVRYLRVREPDVERFRSAYAASTERLVPQSRFSRDPAHSLVLPELEDVWQACRSLPALRDVADVGKGFEYRSDLEAGAQRISSRRFPGAERGFARVGRNLEIHGQPQEVWLNLDQAIVRRRGAGTTVGRPQVLVNYARASRGPWRIKAILDPDGHAVTSNFLTVRPSSEEIPLLYLWSLLNSPFANAYCYAHSSKRHILKKTLQGLPIPRASRRDVQRICEIADAYLRRARGRDNPLWSEASEPERLRDLLLALDAALLRLYDLPPRLERQLLDLFAGWKRCGVPFVLERYFPPDFEPWLPLHVYLEVKARAASRSELRRRHQPAPEGLVKALAAAVEAFGY